ncbi:DVU0298 family protein [Thermosulfuriphilus sp.]
MRPDIYSGDFEIGFCDCGALYLHDATGHNIGAAMVEALTIACRPHQEMAWDLLPDEDYQDALLEHYDLRLHRLVPGGEWEGRRIRGILYFLKLKGDLQGPLPSSPAVSSGPPSPSPPSRRRLSRQQAERLIASGRLGELKDLARASTGVLRSLQKVLYSADESLRWKAVMALAEVAEELCPERVSSVGDLIKGLIWASADSAATNWGALEAVGEIISRCPDLFGDFIRNLVAFLKDDTNRKAALWALGRIGQRNPQLVKPRAFFAIVDLLDDPDPEVRGHALWAILQIGAKEATSFLKQLSNDKGEFRLFDGQRLQTLTVGQLARRGLKAT